jgi:hypothetical protein
VWRRIERWTLLVSAVVVGAALLAMPRAIAFACAAGALLECANASAIRWLVERAMKSKGGATPALGLLLFNLKMAVLIAAVWIALRVLHLDGVGFLLGISVFPVAIVAAALSARLAPAPPATPSDHPARPGGPVHG